MAKATTSKSVMLSVRVPLALHEQIRWRMDATKPPVAFAAMVVNLLWQGLRVSATSAEVAASESKAPKIRKAKAPVPAQGPRKRKAVNHPSKPGPLREDVPGYRLTRTVDAVSTRTVAEQEAHRGDVFSATKALDALRGNPQMKAVQPSADGKSLLPATLPVHTEFPVRAVAQRGAGKGRR